ncbi:MAG TPA: dihydrodipicolinate synthase family protein [Candidatus Acidoferrales bacterium]|nr:dihydrodipicolinate synthase family protein [Candidatus Acidoferrales bacterium]
MVTAKDINGVMAMMPAFSTQDAGDLEATATIAVDNLQASVDRIIRDGVDILATTGSFGECYNLFWDEFKTLAAATVEAVGKRVPVFIGSTSPNPREVVQRLKFIQDIGADGTLLGVPYYDAQTPDYIAEFYRQIGELFPRLGILIYHNPVNHKVKIPVSVFPKLVQVPNIIGMKDSHRDTREFVSLQKIIRGKISVLTNQAQLFPYYKMGAAGCWSIDAWMGPWPVLYLRNLVREGRDEEALQVIGELVGAGGGARPGPDEGSAGKLPLEFAGYCNPGPTRTPVAQFSPEVIERARKKAEHWKSLCAKYRPLVEGQAAKAKAS